MNYFENLILDTIRIQLTNGNLAIQQDVEAFLQMMKEKYGTTPKPKK